MDVPWWVWLLAALYAAPGLYCVVALLTMKPIKSLPEDGEPPHRLLPWWLRVALSPLIFVAVLMLWPLTLWSENDKSGVRAAARERPPPA